MLKKSTLIKVVVLDDHPMITDGLSSLLENSSNFVLTAVTHSLTALISEMTNVQPDILILDLNIQGKNILGNIDDLKMKFPEVKILIFSSYNIPSLIDKVFKKNVNGYLLKDTTQNELLKALIAMSAGETYIGQNVAVAKKNKRIVSDQQDIVDAFNLVNNLSKREIEVILLIVEGLDSKQISSRLFISLHTVQSHRKNIMKKLNLHSSSDIVKFAYENDLVPR